MMLYEYPDRQTHSTGSKISIIIKMKQFIIEYKKKFHMSG